jgi:hypothetical protein
MLFALFPSGNGREKSLSVALTWMERRETDFLWIVPIFRAQNAPDFDLILITLDSGIKPKFCSEIGLILKLPGRNFSELFRIIPPCRSELDPAGPS